jgi:hypothetical protein
MTERRLAAIWGLLLASFELRKAPQRERVDASSNVTVDASGTALLPDSIR